MMTGLKKAVRVFICIGMSLLWASLQSHATLLNLSPPSGLPDLTASFQSVNYSTNNNLFQALGFTTSYSDGSVILADAGAYTLTATITTAGVLTSGSLTIDGDIGSGVETLLTGTLSTGPSGTAFGFDDSGGNIFEFLFTVTGGNATIVSDFGGLGATGGIILDAWFQNGGTPFSGSWTVDFSNDGLSGVSDNFAIIPEPSSISLVLLGGIWLVCSYRVRCKQAAIPTSTLGG